MAEKKENHISLTLEETQLDILEGDITEMDTDAIVNPANEELQLEGPIGGAIDEKGGPAIQEECNRIGRNPVGQSVMTVSGDLPATHVIHTVGPKMSDADSDRRLSMAVRSALALADRHGLKSISLPPISTGSFGFPLERASRIMLTEVHRYLQGGTKIEKVAVVLPDDEAFKTFRQELRKGFR